MPRPTTQAFPKPPARATARGLARPAPGLRERWKTWSRPPRQLVFTSAGKLFVLLTLGIGFAAINTGNNQLFLLLGMMLSLIVASGLLSEAVLRHLAPRRVLPLAAHARTPAPGEFAVDNPGRWPCLSFEIRERPPLCLQGPLKGQTIGAEPHPWWKFWKKAAPEAPVAQTYCLRLDARERARLITRYALLRRGRYQLAGLDCTTRFPFGLFEKSRQIDAAEELVVLPRLEPAVDWTARVLSELGEEPDGSRGMGEEFHGLREYVSGEDARRMHWRSSARRNRLVVRENEAQQHRALHIVLVPFTGEAAHRRHLLEGRFERGLERCAGLVAGLVAQGMTIAFSIGEERVDASQTNAPLERMLEIMATCELVDGLPHADSAPTDDALGARLFLGFAAALAGQLADGDRALEFDSLEALGNDAHNGRHTDEGGRA